MVCAFRRPAVKIALGYAIVSAAWILFSDRLITWITSDPEKLFVLSAGKGWLFVAVTAYLLYIVVNSHVERLRTANSNLSRANDELTAANEELLAIEEELRGQYDEIENGAKILRQREELFMSRYEGIKAGIFVFDLQGNLVHANAEAIHFFGLPWEELRQRKTFSKEWNLYAANDSLLPVEKYPMNTALKTGNPVQGAVVGAYSPVRGKICWQLLDAEPIREAHSGKITEVIVTCRDITDLKQAQEALQASKEQFQSLFNNMAEGVAMHTLVRDAAGNPVDYFVVEVNSGFENILKMRRQDVVGKLATEVYGTATAPYLAEYGAVVQSRRPVSLTTYAAFLDRYFSVSIAPWSEDGFATIFNDVTEQKRANQSVKESEERYRAILQQSPVAIAVIDSGTKRFLEVNACWLNMLGYTTEEVAEITAYDIYPYEDIQGDHEAGALKRTMLRRLRRKNGNRIEVENSTSIIRYAAKEMLLFISRDLSAERKLQELISKDVALAAEVQRNMLQQGFYDILLSVDVIYEPFHLVSSDFYDYAWSHDHQKFSGFILDVSGHGVASSLRSIAAGAYFRDVLESPMRPAAKLEWINQRVQRYFAEGAYGSAIYFEFDFMRQTLSFAGAGSYGFMAASGALPDIVRKESSFIGVAEAPEYEEWTVPIQQREAFYFTSDGILSQVWEEKDIKPSSYEQTVSRLRELAIGPARRDDCCALCIRINGQPVFPIRFQVHRPGEYSRVRQRIRSLLRRIAADQAGKVEVALGEALNNGARESMDVDVKISLFRRRLVIRVRDGGGGFDGNARVAEFSAIDEEFSFAERLYAEGGRGILIMAAWMDRVIYNRKGNEVLLMKQL